MASGKLENLQILWNVPLQKNGIILCVFYCSQFLKPTGLTLTAGVFRARGLYVWPPLYSSKQVHHLSCVFFFIKMLLELLKNVIQPRMLQQPDTQEDKDNTEGEIFFHPPNKCKKQRNLYDQREGVQATERISWNERTQTVNVMVS